MPHAPRQRTVPAFAWSNVFLFIVGAVAVAAMCVAMIALLRSPLTTTHTTLLDELSTVDHTALRNLALMDQKALAQLRMVDGVLVLGDVTDPTFDGVFVVSRSDDADAKKWFADNEASIGKGMGILVGGPEAGNSAMYWYWQKPDGTTVGLAQAFGYQP